MGKPILTHTITANSFDEISALSHAWIKKMEGKIEILDVTCSPSAKGHQFWTVEYYYLDKPWVQFTKEELEYIAETFHDALKDQPNDPVLRSIENKANEALGWM